MTDTSILPSQPNPFKKRWRFYGGGQNERPLMNLAFTTGSGDQLGDAELARMLI